MPEPGAKKRETKSHPGVVARLVTMTPRTGSVRSRAKSGARRAHRRFALELDEVVEAALADVPRRRAERLGKAGRADRRGVVGRRRKVELDPVALRAAVSRPLFV